MEKKKIKFNIIDLLIVIALILLVLGIVFRDDVVGVLENRENVTLRYSYEVSAYPADGGAYFADGYELFDSESKESLGTFSGNGKATTALEPVEINGKGALLSVQNSDKVDIKGYVEVSAYKDGDGCYYTENGFHLAAGVELDAVTKFHEFKATVISLEEVEAPYAADAAVVNESAQTES